MDKKYKPLKKAKDCYYMPFVLKSLLECQMFSKNGIFVGNNGMCSALYRIVPDVPGKNFMFKELRTQGYDVDFYELQGEHYLVWYRLLDVFDDAPANWKEAEQGFLPGTALERLGFQERMQWSYNLFHLNASKDIDFGEDINLFSSGFTHPAERVDEKSIQMGEKYYRCCYVRKFSEDKNAVSELMEDPDFVLRKTSLRCVTDYMVSTKYKDTYLDYEPVVANAKRWGTDLYRVMTSTIDSPDERTYTLGSLLLLLAADKKEELEVLYQEKKAYYRKKKLNLDYFYHAQTMKAFLPGYDAFDQNRLLRSETACLLVPGQRSVKVHLRKEDVNEAI